MMTQSKFLGKKILFFSVQTFNLEKEIKTKLEELGATVVYFDERPANSILVKGIIRLRKSLYKNKINKYYRDVLKKIVNNQFDYLFVNKGEVIPEFFLQEFRKLQPDCIRIFYTWDSFANNKNPEVILKYFDRKFSFDTKDAINYKLNFRPLFYLDHYRSIYSNNITKKYDLVFLGTAHSDRYKISNEVNDWCQENGLKTFFYYYLPGKIVYYIKRKIDKTFQQFDVKKISFKSLTTQEILNFYKESNVILDINHPSQNGLTLRVFEAIGAGKKLITTNQEIKKYSFYNPKNIYIIDRHDIKLDLSFFREKYQNISDELYKRASLEGWLNCLFFEKESSLWVKDII
jgi:hypothetical protein